VKALLSWIRDFVDVPGTPEEIGARMSLRGLALEGIEAVGDAPLPPGRTRTGDDAVLDFDVTANRPDCLSILGIAREIATVYGLPLQEPDARLAGDGGVSAGGDAVVLPVTIERPDLCRRYVAAIADVTIGPSPAWMQARLTACGVRPISNVVDITNYVLLERGQPMHAFDFARLRGPAIVVRAAKSGERLVTLDGKERALTTSMLVIADAEGAAAIGGVMGGADSEVSSATTQIVFESAWFSPPSVRATGKALGLRTEASYRFERGADLAGSAQAMHRALSLLESTSAGKARGVIIDVSPAPFEPRELVIEKPAISQLLGMDVPEDDSERILRSLGFDVCSLGGWQFEGSEAAAPVIHSGPIWQVTVPSWRVDILRPVDLVEEVGRHYGFEHLPTTFPPVEQAPPPSDPRIARDTRVRRGLLAMGLSEAITFAFIEAAAAAPWLGEERGVALANPLSEKFTTLRPSLLPGLVDVVSHNRRHGLRDVRVFEIGTRFSASGETRSAAVAWTGAAVLEHWSGGKRDVDFFDVKGVAQQLGAILDVPLRFAQAAVPYLVEGRTADIRAGERLIGVVGQLAPSIAERRGLPAADAVHVLEIDLDALSAAAKLDARMVTSLPRHPSIVRDVSVLVDHSLSAETVRGTIRAAAPATLVDVREFDRYQGKGIPDGKVSLSLRLSFQAPDRTLTDGEVHAAMDAIVSALTKELGAVQR
jgi:phenylalanyl-tRNA synthetase beta chain